MSQLGTYGPVRGQLPSLPQPNDSANDALVHQTITAATQKSHDTMEECLKKNLKIEGWDQTTFIMREAFRKKPARAL